MAEESYGRCAACGCVGPNPGYSAMPPEVKLKNWKIEKLSFKEVR